jgi:transposase
VDDAGQGIPIVNSHSGEVYAAALCIAVLRASNSTSAEVTWSQALPDWIGSHIRPFAALGGVPEVVVPDSLKTAVQRAHSDAPDCKRHTSWHDWS